MTWRVATGPGARDDALERLSAGIDGIGREADRAQAAQCLAMAGAIDLATYDEPIELIADGHVKQPGADTVPSWVRVQVSTREPLPVDEDIDDSAAHAEVPVSKVGGDPTVVGTPPTGDVDADGAAPDADTAGTPDPDASLAETASRRGGKPT